jgi:hypothetical protein
MKRNLCERVSSIKTAVFRHEETANVPIPACDFVYGIGCHVLIRKYSVPDYCCMFVQHIVSNTFTDRAASSNCFNIIIVIATRTHSRTRSTFIVFKRKRRNLAPNGRWVLPISHLTPQISLTRCKILRLETDGFTSPPKEVVLRISMAIKNPPSSAGFEPANFGSIGKYANH